MKFMCSLANSMTARYRGVSPCVNLFCLVSNLFVLCQTFLQGDNSIFDRIQYGVIAAFFGLIVGGLIALIVVGFFYLVVGEPRPFNIWLVWFSVAFYFAVGMSRGADAAETIVDGLVASALVVMGGAGVNGSGQIVDGEFEWRRGRWWSVIFFVGIALVAWLL